MKEHTQKYSTSEADTLKSISGCAHEEARKAVNLLFFETFF